ncbi:hypothetical protein [Hymenobacter sp. BRD67]|uniref:hypothetical protein n=1 Tax=Hymenobacter sp. BRD67 TaxID=2675877 RepID=UPI0015656026|nr:hypothetical protein [Hymenobacter sp. BRD67]QKG51619.1 hypothetical protein GKZ67_02190 [Hymenobacter sp. BRD67]
MKYAYKGGRCRMARVKLEAGRGIASLSGRIGNLVFRTMADGQTYAQLAPVLVKRSGSVAQQQWRQGTFREAVAYGKAQQASAEGRAYYQPHVRPGSFGSVYSMALADYTKPPLVLAVEAEQYRGQGSVQLRIRAQDPFGVVAVRVQILNEAGQVLEEGTAEAVGDDWWHYVTGQAHPTGAARQLRAVAIDRPGNEGDYILNLG